MDGAADGQALMMVMTMMVMMVMIVMMMVVLFLMKAPEHIGDTV